MSDKLLPNSNKITFEEALPIIDRLIERRRYKWTLKAVTAMDYDDVSQIIRIHIYKKWGQYDEKFALEPWINKIIIHQTSNLVRNNYSAHERPCLGCAENQGNDLCGTYEKQCNACPLYAKWERTKKRAHDVKLPVSIENHTQELFEMPSESFELEKAIENFHIKMKEVLKPIEWKIYNLLYVKNVSEAEAAKEMGYTSGENKRAAGYNNFIRFKRRIMEKANKIKKEIDFI